MAPFRIDILKYSSQDRYYPTQPTRSAAAEAQICLECETHDGGPENDLKGIEDEIRFEGCPFPEATCVLCEQLVGEEDEGFEALCSRVSIRHDLSRS